jgi:hypothetical protein
VLDSVGNFRFHKNKDTFKKKSVVFSTVRVTHATTFEVSPLCFVVIVVIVCVFVFFFGIKCCF